MQLHPLHKTNIDLRCGFALFYSELFKDTPSSPGGLPASRKEDVLVYERELQGRNSTARMFEWCWLIENSLLQNLESRGPDSPKPPLASVWLLHSVPYGLFNVRHVSHRGTSEISLRLSEVSRSRAWRLPPSFILKLDKETEAQDIFRVRLTSPCTRPKIIMLRKSHVGN